MMRAIVLKAPGELELQHRPDPKCSQNNVIVKMSYSGICGTDLSIFSGHMPVNHPRILGHELAGEVLEGGDGSFRAGDRVVVDPSLSCGTCFSCRAGLINLCRHGGLIGREIDGGFAEYVAVPQSQLFPLPDTIDLRCAPLIQVLSTCVHSQQMVEILPGQAVLINGLGVTGQLQVQLAKHRGAGRVIGISRSAWKRSLAEKLGSDITLPRSPTVLQSVLDATDGRGADVVIECTGKTAMIAESILMARPGGTLSLYGTATDTKCELSFYQMYLKELRVLNTRASIGRDFLPSIDLVRRGAVKLDPLVTARVPLSDLASAMQQVDSDDEQRMKIMIEH
jgi:2-desacetyl-2-hydroxyethyl bacteriochlorophyllide A dehydrogenase